MTKGRDQCYNLSRIHRVTYERLHNRFALGKEILYILIKVYVNQILEICQSFLALPLMQWISAMSH